VGSTKILTLAAKITTGTNVQKREWGVYTGKIKARTSGGIRGGRICQERRRKASRIAYAKVLTELGLREGVLYRWRIRGGNVAKNRPHVQTHKKTAVIKRNVRI